MHPSLNSEHFAARSNGNDSCPDCAARPTIEFTVYGQPVVKKNTQKVVARGRYAVKIDSPQYREWHRGALLQLQNYRRQFGEICPIDYPINLCLGFVVPTRRRFDLSNMYEGIQDTLVEAGILADDYWAIVTGHDGSKVIIDRSLEPCIRVKITPAHRHYI